MIKFKELENKIYKNNICISFMYVIQNKDIKIPVQFNRNEETIDRIWDLTIVIPRRQEADSQVYCFTFVMPITGIPLEKIAATGLMHFQQLLKKELEFKIATDFLLGEILEGM